MLLHDFAGSLDNSADATFTHEHVMGFLGEHEAASARQRIEAGFGQGAELKFAVAVGEESEHIEGQPVRRGLVEGAQDARVVGVTRAASEQRFGFFAAIATEIAVQQVDHGPQVAAFFDVDLKNVAQVVEGGAGQCRAFSAAPLKPARCRLG